MLYSSTSAKEHKIVPTNVQFAQFNLSGVLCAFLTKFLVILLSRKKK